jgi:hypothetical protein
MPNVIPNGLLCPFSFIAEDKIIGSNGQIHGAKIVTNPEINANSTNIIII